MRSMKNKRGNVVFEGIAALVERWCAEEVGVSCAHMYGW